MLRRERRLCPNKTWGYARLHSSQVFSRQNLFPLNVTRLPVCLSVRGEKLRCTKDSKSPAEINALPFFFPQRRLLFGSSARLRLFDMAYYCWEVKRLTFIPSITSEPYESCYAWNRAQHECHYALSRQVVLRQQQTMLRFHQSSIY